MTAESLFAYGLRLSLHLHLHLHLERQFQAARASPADRGMRWQGARPSPPTMAGFLATSAGDATWSTAAHSSTIASCVSKTRAMCACLARLLRAACSPTERQLASRQQHQQGRRHWWRAPPAPAAERSQRLPCLWSGACLRGSAITLAHLISVITTASYVCPMPTGEVRATASATLMGCRSQKANADVGASLLRAWQLRSAAHPIPSLNLPTLG